MSRHVRRKHDQRVSPFKPKYAGMFLLLLAGFGIYCRLDLQCTGYAGEQKQFENKMEAAERDLAKEIDRWATNNTAEALQWFADKHLFKMEPRPDQIAFYDPMTGAVECHPVAQKIIKNSPVKTVGH